MHGPDMRRPEEGLQSRLLIRNERVVMNEANSLQAASKADPRRIRRQLSCRPTFETTAKMRRSLARRPQPLASTDVPGEIGGVFAAAH